MHLTNCISTPTFLLVASYQISQNDAILMNQKLFFQENDSLQLNSFQFPKMNTLLPYSAICLQEFCFGNLFLNGFSH